MVEELLLVASEVRTAGFKLLLIDYVVQYATGMRNILR